MRIPRNARRCGALALGIAVCGWLIVGVAASASAASTTLDGITYTVDDAHPELGATAASYTPGSGVIDIPSHVTIGATSYPVTSVADNAFNAENVTAVTIPSTVTTIGSFAFSNNNSLASVTLPNSVTSVGNSAFNADNLTSLTLSSGLTELGDHSFANNNQLESVTIPDGVTTIDFAAFAADDLRNLVLGNGVTTIAASAFAFNNNLATVLIPASVTSFGNDVFQNNSSGSLLATFEGAPPTTFGTGVFATANPLVIYDIAFGDPPLAGGFTSPTWMGYPSSGEAKVTFDANGHGTSPAPAFAAAGHVLVSGKIPSPPTAPGFGFVGWFTAASGGTQWDFATQFFTTDITLFAHWTASSDPATLPETGVDATPPLIIGSIIVVAGLLLLLLAGLRRRRRRNVPPAEPLEKQK